MAFPDRIERSLALDQPPSTVWAALTTVEGLSSWFGEEATLDLRPGGAGRLTWSDGGTVDLRVERVDEPTVFGFTWLHGRPPGAAGRTYVEFALEAAGAGTHLTVVETGFAQLPEELRSSEYEAHDRGWTNELGELAAYLAG